MNIEQVIRDFGKKPKTKEHSEAVLALCQEAIRITMELNTAYHKPEEIINIMSELTGKEVDPSFTLFPPFYTDFGKKEYRKTGILEHLKQCCDTWQRHKRQQG